MKRIPSWLRLYELIRDGYGCGYLDTYKTWLRIHRKNASPVSSQVVAPMPGYQRQAHFFARIEWYVALLCLWLGAYDVREQYPLWPMRHKHPLSFGLPAWRAPEIIGLWQIAEQAGVRHGFEVGSDGVPYVATMDIMATLDDGRHLDLSGISLKPHDKISLAEPTDRLVERQELERRYMVIVDGHYTIPDNSLMSPTLQGNLDVCGRFAKTVLSDSNRVTDFLAFIDDTCGRLDQHTAVRLGARATGISTRVAREQLMAAIWRRAVDVDITRPIRPDLPLTGGGSKIASLLQRELFGREL